MKPRNSFPVISVLWSMPVKSLIAALIMLVSCSSAQVALYPPNSANAHVVLFGHSWIAAMNGFAPWAFPNLPSANVSVRGHGSLTCSGLLIWMQGDIASTTDVVFMMLATNDILRNTDVSWHMACVEQAVQMALQKNPRMKVLLSNVPPWGASTLAQYGDKRPLIAAYNAAYPLLAQRYAQVSIVDMWSPTVQTDGWALPNVIDGPLGYHFGPNGQYEVMGIIRDAVYGAIAAMSQ